MFSKLRKVVESLLENFHVQNLLFIHSPLVPNVQAMDNLHSADVKNEFGYCKYHTFELLIKVKEDSDFTKNERKEDPTIRHTCSFDWAM